MISPVDSETFKTHFSEWCFGNYDSIYAQRNVKQGYLPSHLVREFMEYAGYILTTKEISVYLKKFVDFILSKRKGNPQNLQDKGGARKGELKFWKDMPQNMAVIEGEGTPYPILEICDSRPLFHIQRGYLLVLLNVRIEYHGSPNNIFLESSAPSFFLDPESTSVVGVEKCAERAAEGLFLLRHPIWIGKPDRNPYDKIRN